MSRDIRENARKVFRQVVASDDEARDVESSCYNRAYDVSVRMDTGVCWENPAFKNVYITTCAHVYAYIDPESKLNNDDLLSRIREGVIQVKDIPNMAEENLFPEVWTETIQNCEKNNRAMLLQRKAKTDRFVCPRRSCRSRETDYYEMQTRSADEPMTIFITCLKCNHRWRQ